MKKPIQSTEAASLRQRAEEIARGKAAPPLENLEALSPEEVRLALHELQVHQIELEMQNEELRRTQVELVTERAHYFDFYDLAPVGYITINEKGLILETNLNAAGMLGKARGALVKQLLTGFIFVEDQDIHYLHFKKLFETGEAQNYQLRMLKKDGTHFWAHISVISAQGADGAPVCRAVLSDISERVENEAVLRPYWIA